MKNHIRTLDAFLILILKLLYLYDIFHFLLISPLESVLGKRLSEVLLVSPEGKLNMSLSRKLINKIQKLNYLHDSVQLLIILKQHFTAALLQLPPGIYTVEVNENIYRLLNLNTAFAGINIQILDKTERKQLSAKLLLVSSKYIWKTIISGRFLTLMKKLNRQETVYSIQLQIS